MQNHISTQTIAVRKVIGIVRKISLMVLTEYNPSGSRPNFFGRQHLTFDKGGKCDSAFRGIVRSGGHGEVMWVLLKNYGFTAGHHFDEC